MLYAFLIPLLWLVSFIFAVAKEDKLKITKYSYPSSGSRGILWTGKARDAHTDFVSRKLWFYSIKKCYVINFRVTKYK